MMTTPMSVSPPASIAWYGTASSTSGVLGKRTKLKPPAPFEARKPNEPVPIGTTVTAPSSSRTCPVTTTGTDGTPGLRVTVKSSATGLSLMQVTLNVTVPIDDWPRASLAVYVKLLEVLQVVVGGVKEIIAGLMLARSPSTSNT